MGFIDSKQAPSEFTCVCPGRVSGRMLGQVQRCKGVHLIGTMFDVFFFEISCYGLSHAVPKSYSSWKMPELDSQIWTKIL